MTNEIKQRLRQEFAGMKPPSGCAGGCRKSVDMPGYCVLFSFEKVTKIKLNCKLYKVCEGNELTYPF